VVITAADAELFVIAEQVAADRLRVPKSKGVPATGRNAPVTILAGV
jgi:hypothetical protein